MQPLRPLLLAATVTVALSAQAQTKWDLPAAYPATNFHTENLVQFANAGERIELVHRATSRDIFARGALHVAQRLATRGRGRYRVADLL